MKLTNKEQDERIERLKPLIGHRVRGKGDGDKKIVGLLQYVGPMGITARIMTEDGKLRRVYARSVEEDNNERRDSEEYS